MKGKVFALDEDEEAVRLTTSNAKKFDAQDIAQVFCGKTPKAMRGLPKADAILIGGSKNLRETIQAAPGILKAHGRIVVNAILLETATTALEELKKAGFKEIDVTQVFVAKGKDIDHGTMMLARNPITIVSATKA
jgi:cobalt-precorrin-6B (C15)-methyltransferase